MVCILAWIVGAEWEPADTAGECSSAAAAKNARSGAKPVIVQS